MKLFLRRNTGTKLFSNVLVSLLCTSCLFVNYTNNLKINDKEQPEKQEVLEVSDTEVPSQSGNKETKIKPTKITTVVKKKSVNSSNKNYVPAKYSAVTGEAIVNYAKKYLGLRYVSGGNSLSTGTDCSGFTKLIYREFGINLSRAVKSQAHNGSYVKKSDLRKGDLVFYGYGNGVVRHVAIYIGNGQVIHESTYKYGVKISTLNMMEYITARRVINDKSIEIVEKQNEEKKEENIKLEENSTIENSISEETNVSIIEEKNIVEENIEEVNKDEITDNTLNTSSDNSKDIVKSEETTEETTEENTKVQNLKEDVKETIEIKEETLPEQSKETETKVSIPKESKIVEEPKKVEVPEEKVYTSSEF